MSTLVGRATFSVLGLSAWSETEAILSYSSGDPLVIRVAFENDKDVVWLFGRDLLLQGLDKPAGYHDVRVWPSSLPSDVLYVHLRTPSGEALLETSRSTLRGFLLGTVALVPLGSEAEHLDFTLTP